MRSVDSETFEPKPNGERDNSEMELIVEADRLVHLASNKPLEAKLGRVNTK